MASAFVKKFSFSKKYNMGSGVQIVRKNLKFEQRSIQGKFKQIFKWVNQNYESKVFLQNKENISSNGFGFSFFGSVFFVVWGCQGRPKKSSKLFEQRTLGTILFELRKKIKQCSMDILYNHEREHSSRWWLPKECGLGEDSVEKRHLFYFFGGKKYFFLQKCPKMTQKVIWGLWSNFDKMGSPL